MHMNFVKKNIYRFYGMTNTHKNKPARLLRLHHKYLIFVYKVFSSELACITNITPLAMATPLPDGMFPSVFR